MNNRIKRFYEHTDCDVPQAGDESDADFGCDDAIDLSLPPEMASLIASQIASQSEATYQTMSYAAVEKMMLISVEQHSPLISKPREIPPELGSVLDMTKRLFPGCAIKADMIDGEQFNEQSHVVIRVEWSDAQMTNEQKNDSLVAWHSELFVAAPHVSAGAFRLQVEYPE